MLFDHAGPGGDYEQLIVQQDPALGFRVMVAIHSTRRGPAFGGIRRCEYRSDSEALADLLGLAEAMTLKCALAGLPAGGGKSIIWPDPLVRIDRPAAYRATGRIVKSLGGRYVCGPDLGTGTAELAQVRRQTRHVNPEPNDAGASTASGVEAGLRAVWSVLGMTPGPTLTVAVQGLGAVGRTLARSLLDKNVKVIGTDLRPEAMAAAGAVGVQVVPPDEILRAKCDVLSPCAVGGVITEAIVPQLRCRAICGSANNQLSDPIVAESLHDRGIVFVPDIVVSAGAVTEGVYTILEGESADVRDKVRRSIEALEGIAAQILGEAASRNLPPDLVARARGRAILEET